ncbi:TetR/AcrR family transcriptional regulator [Rhodococcus erythropolis]|uniref:TetR/AcrR family transcriptional regulator n=1 Tax=Rhodococcus erythropolis TaxID=1833 RepID=UPI002226E821|nr:TetR/AcrR family transcriptional regulator [Rhodococcus erythropolis]MCW2298854.1 AcrR family transcriptional regulator [Rhodococcus erythropolis]
MARQVAERSDTIPALANVFRTYGFDGASLAVITEHTGLGKGSLYNFFPRGKEEMAEAVLDEVDGWFRTEVFEPLRAESVPPRQRIESMFATVADYFRSGQRICLFGAFALGEERNRFGAKVRTYFDEWTAALKAALVGAEDSTGLAEEAVAGIQGAIVMSRALDDGAVYSRVTTRLEDRLAQALTP